MDEDEGKFDLKIISQRWWRKYHIPVVPKNVSARLRTATTTAKRQQNDSKTDDSKTDDSKDDDSIQNVLSETSSYPLP
tara:strand:+ start:835 stop:1068 length:234 start_codon:yes stop_codon:yes gene_type:complete